MYQPRFRKREETKKVQVFFEKTCSAFIHCTSVLFGSPIQLMSLCINLVFVSARKRKKCKSSSRRLKELSSIARRSSKFEHRTSNNEQRKPETGNRKSLRMLPCLVFLWLICKGLKIEFEIKKVFQTNV